MDELRDRAALELLHRLQQRRHVVVERRRLATRDVLALHRVVVGVPDDEHDLVEVELVERREVGEAVDMDVAVCGRRRRPAHGDHVRALLEDVGPEEPAAAEEDRSLAR